MASLLRSITGAVRSAHARQVRRDIINGTDHANTAVKTAQLVGGMMLGASIQMGIFHAAGTFDQSDIQNSSGNSRAEKKIAELMTHDCGFPKKSSTGGLKGRIIETMKHDCGFPK